MDNKHGSAVAEPEERRQHPRNDDPAEQGFCGDKDMPSEGSMRIDVIRPARPRPWDRDTRQSER